MSIHFESFNKECVTTHQRTIGQIYVESGGGGGGGLLAAELVSFEIAYCFIKAVISIPLFDFTAMNFKVYIKIL